MNETLKLFAGTDAEAATLETPRGQNTMRAINTAFAGATGWNLVAELVDDFQFMPGDPAGTDARPLRIVPAQDMALYGPPVVERARAQHLATAIGRLADELRRTERTLREREVELAVEAVADHGDRRKHIASRLERILRDGAKLLGCRRAGVYLLDGDSMRLKLRAAWNLKRSRLAAPGRPLAESSGDLNALSDYDVILTSRQQTEVWQAPVTCESALCAPLYAGDVALGTVWFFSRKPRGFAKRHAALARLFAERISVELDREGLLAQTQRLTQLQRELDEATRSAERIARSAPLLENWQIAGWTRRPAGIAGAFHAWHAVAGEAAWVAVGEANGKRLAASQRAAALAASLESIWRHTASPPALLANANARLWQREAGDALATVVAARVETDDHVKLSVAGDPCVLLITADGAKELTDVSAPLGLGGRLKPDEHIAQVQSGAALLIATSGVRDALDVEGRLFGVQGIVKALRGAFGHAQAMCDALSAALNAHCAGVSNADCSAIVVCRR